MDSVDIALVFFSRKTLDEVQGFSVVCGLLTPTS